jgi:predicted lipoprotein with Yx(FWY)xxD motif
MARAALIAVVMLTVVSAAGAAAGPTVKTAVNPSLKQAMLVTATGRSLYLFVGETPTRFGCVGSCLRNWPPLTAKGAPVAGAGVKASLLRTTKRSDTGALQVTYAGHPLYTFAGYPPTPADKKPGDIRGQGFGSLWFVLSPSGKAIKKTP